MDFARRGFSCNVGSCTTPQNGTGGAVALELRVRIFPVGDSWRTLVGDVLSPSLIAHVEVAGSAAAKKCACPRVFLKSEPGPLPQTRAFRGGDAPKNT